MKKFLSLEIFYTHAVTDVTDKYEVCSLFYLSASELKRPMISSKDQCESNCKAVKRSVKVLKCGIESDQRRGIECI